MGAVTAFRSCEACFWASSPTKTYVHTVLTFVIEYMELKGVESGCGRAGAGLPTGLAPHEAPKTARCATPAGANS